MTLQGFEALNHMNILPTSPGLVKHKKGKKRNEHYAESLINLQAEAHCAAFFITGMECLSVISG